MTCSTGIDCAGTGRPMSRRYYPRRPARGSLPWLATLIVLAVFAAWQGYGRNITADSGSAQANATSSSASSPSVSGSFASAFKAPISYATALRYARQESVTTPHLAGVQP